MLSISGERSLISCVVPPKTMHINGIMSLSSCNMFDLLCIATSFASVPLDYLIKATGMNNLRISTIMYKNNDIESA